jgi:hypothetical protein
MMMGEFVQKGGTIIWSGPPPIINSRGENCQKTWEALFGVHYEASTFMGEIAAGKVVTFQNSLKAVPEQTILTDFIVDRIYPLNNYAGSEIVARVDEHVVGVKRNLGRGTTCFLGFRPRDDQSASLGKEQRTWFEVLNALKVYPSTGRFSGVNDNTEYISRCTNYLTTRFPNGTTIIASHYRNHRESWSGGFARDVETDKKIIQQNPLPQDVLELNNFKVNGHEISYSGRLILAIRTDNQGEPIGFEGHDCDRVRIDGQVYTFAKQKQKHIAWSPVADNRQIPDKAFLQIYVDGSGEIKIPLKTNRRNLELFTESQVPGSMGKQVPITYENGYLNFIITPENARRWLYLNGSML